MPPEDKSRLLARRANVPLNSGEMGFATQAEPLARYGVCNTPDSPYREAA